VVTGTPDERLELLNTLGTDINITYWTIWKSKSTAPYWFLDGNITANTVIPANGYYVLDKDNIDVVYSTWTTGITLTNGGDTVVLNSSTGVIIDVIAYGNEGSAPVHPGPGSSIARVGTTGDNASNWNIDLTPTLGSANDAPGTNLGGEDVVINEVNTFEDWIELYNNNPTQTVDLTGWTIGSGTSNLFTMYGSIEPLKHVVFYASDPLAPSSYSPLFFSSTTDQIYLYNSTGARVDQMGYNTKLTTQTWNRFPDGNLTVPSNGYNNLTSGFIALDPTNEGAARTFVNEFLINQSTVALNGAVDVAVQLQLTNGSTVGFANATVNVSLNNVATDLVYDAVSGYYNGTVDFTGYTPQTNTYGFYQTTELLVQANTTGLGPPVSGTAGVLVNPGYTSTDTVIMFDEAHGQFYTFSDY
ncbi:MAG: lamin tail domain-containing protein, partial [Candidatus Heimdallarchaeota archaeon]